MTLLVEPLVVTGGFPPEPYPYLEARLIRRFVSPDAPHARAAIGPIQAALGVTFTESLYDAGSAEITVPLDAQDSVVRSALGAIDQTPVEVQLLYNSAPGLAKTWQGPVVGWQQVRVGQEGLGLRLKCLGMGHYLEGLPLPARLHATRFQATDEPMTDIAAAAIDGAQAEGSFSDFGFTMVATGTPIPDHTVDLPTHTTVMALLRSMAEQEGTCDVLVTGGTGPDGDGSPIVRLDFPRRGTDKTAEVIVDRRSVVDPAWALSAGLDDFCTQVRAVGKIADTETTVVATNAAAEALWGRRFLPVPAGTDIITSAALASFADRALAERRVPSVLAAPVLVTGQAIEVTSFDLGDRIQVDYDPEIGLPFRGTYRVVAHTTVFDDNTEAARVDLDIVPEEVP